jgi:hypothetical protein
MSFWLLEEKRRPLFLGVSCGRFKYSVGLEEALKFFSKEDAENFAIAMDDVLKAETDPLLKHYGAVEHMFMDANT